jgi:hypothetical protein
MVDFAERYLAQCPKRPTQTEAWFQSARTFWTVVDFRATLLGKMSFLPGDTWRNAGFPRRFFAQSR